MSFQVPLEDASVDSEKTKCKFKQKKISKTLVQKKNLRIYLSKGHLEGIGLSFGDLIFGNAVVNHIPCELIRILPIINQTKQLHHISSEIKKERPIKSRLRLLRPKFFSLFFPLIV